VPPRTDLRDVAFLGRKIRCLLVHDHILLRQGLRRLLQDEPDIEVVAEAGNAAECLRKLYEFRPDVLITDTRTFDLPAHEVELLVTRESSQTKIAFLSMQEQSISPFGGPKRPIGISAVRQTSAEDVVEMVRNLCGDIAAREAGNNISTSHLVTNHVLPHRIPTIDLPREQQEAPARRAVQRFSETQFPQERALTAREREVLKLLAEGKTVRVAATILGVSSKTVDAHKFNLMRKLGIHNKAELVMWAIRKRVLKLPANF
jgi:two-component system, NarL family, response regulator NreC